MDQGIRVIGMKIRVDLERVKWSLRVWFQADINLLMTTVPEILIDKILEDDAFEAMERVARLLGREVEEYQAEGSGRYRVILKPLPGAERPGVGGFQRCLNTSALGQCS